MKWGRICCGFLISFSFSFLSSKGGVRTQLLLRAMPEPLREALALCCNIERSGVYSSLQIRSSRSRKRVRKGGEKSGVC